MPERLVAVDPGKISGVAYADFHENKILVQSFEYEQMETIEYVEIMVKDCDAVACESFVPRPGVRTWQPHALEIIGAVRYLCHKAGIPFNLQAPASAKTFATNAKLKKLSWWNPSPDGHANDALRHLLLLAVKRGAISPEVFT